MNNLKLLHWNSNGLSNKTNELNALAKNLKIDIILISETPLKPSQIFKISNYHIYRTDLPPVRGSPAHGGTAVLVHRRIVHQQIKLPTKLQSTSIKIKVNNIEILISAIYKPPRQILDPNDLDIITKSSDWIVAAGDFNAKHPIWNSRKINPAGNILSKHLQKNDYAVFAPTTPTYYPFSQYHNPDVLDIALVRLPLFTQVFNINDLSSDHNPVMLEFNCTPITSTPPRPKRIINWLKYTELLRTQYTDPNPIIKNQSDIDTAINNFSSSIQSAIEASVYITKKVKASNYLPDEILNEIREKNRLRREWQLNRDPSIKRKLNSKTTFIRNILKTHRQDEWDKFLISLNSNDNSIYQLNKCLLSKRPATHPLMGPSGLVYSATEKSELFADALELQFTPNPGQDIYEVSKTVDQIKRTVISDSVFSPLQAKFKKS